MNKKKDRNESISSKRKKSQNESSALFNSSSARKDVDFAIATKIIEYMQIEEKF